MTWEGSGTIAMNWVTIDATSAVDSAWPAASCSTGWSAWAPGGSVRGSQGGIGSWRAHAPRTFMRSCAASRSAARTCNASSTDRPISASPHSSRDVPRLAVSKAIASG